MTPATAVRALAPKADDGPAADVDELIRRVDAALADDGQLL
jgi:hypothetical protein